MKHARTALTMQRAILLLFLTPAAPTAAVQYQISYEANTPGSFPEDEGWERTFEDGGANRTLADGALTLESTGLLVRDSYRWDMQGNLDPDPGEMFFTEWRLRIDSLTPGPFEGQDLEPGVIIARDGRGGPFGGGTVAFGFGIDFVVERADTQNPSDRIFFEPGIFHTFRFESIDMDNWELFIDGQVALTGMFDSPSTNMSFVAFGDPMTGPTMSTSTWDYVRFGVIPAPSTAYLLVIGFFWLNKRRPMPSERRPVEKEYYHDSTTHNKCSCLPVHTAHRVGREGHHGVGRPPPYERLLDQ